MSDLPTTILGRTGAKVTKLGFGAMELMGLRRPPLPAREAAALLNAVLDAGINVIDTAGCYGPSESQIGDHLSHRRGEFFLATKCGCSLRDNDVRPDGRPSHYVDRANFRAGVERSLSRMKTDYLDLVQIHLSPSRAALEENDSIAELLALKKEGKVRFIGMSGALPNLPDHIAMGVFDVFQIPYSALEWEHEALIAEANKAGAGIIVRGGVAKGAPVASQGSIAELKDIGDRMRAHRARYEAIGADDLLNGMSRMEFMLRFTLSNPFMHTTIVGTANPAHLADNVAAAGKGSLPPDVYAEALRRLDGVRQ